MVKPFRFWCQHVNPFVYDDSLSVYETLCKTIDKLNEVIEQLNAQESAVMETIKNLFYSYQLETDAKIDNEIKNGLEELDKYLKDAIQKQNLCLTTTLTAYSKKWDLQLQHQNCQINTLINCLKCYVQEQITLIYKTIEVNNDWNKKYIAQEIDKLREEIPTIQSINVRSPIDGEIKPLADVLTDMFNVLRCCALTAIEYDTANLTAEQYDKMQIHAFCYDYYGDHYIRPWLVIHAIHNPFTGKWGSMQQVIYNLMDYHKPNGLTAREYDNLTLSAMRYDNTNIAAYTYDFTAKQILSEV